VVALMYAFVAGAIAHRAANGLSSGDWVPLVDRLMMLFLLLVGFSALGMAFSRQREPRKAMGLVSRPGLLHEFGTGSAVGWGLLLLTVVPSVFIGGLGVTLWSASHQWFLLILDLLVLAIAALCEELIFRGYPFQRLTDAIGTTLGSVLISICFVVVHYQPDSVHRLSAHARLVAAVGPAFCLERGDGASFRPAAQRLQRVCQWLFAGRAKLAAGSGVADGRRLWPGGQRHRCTGVVLRPLADHAGNAGVCEPLWLPGDHPGRHPGGHRCGSPAAA
jgi:membrane protease YdiL (CAAX protease family)